jgi:hypothetical protein
MTRSVKWDAAALSTFTTVAAVCYLAWWQAGYGASFCYRTGLLVVAGLGFWLRWLWPRLALWLTKFFCLAALFDLLLEAFLHPFHPATLLAKLACQLMLFGVYALYLAVLRPVDVWLHRGEKSPVVEVRATVT